MGCQNFENQYVYLVNCEQLRPNKEFTSFIKHTKNPFGQIVIKAEHTLNFLDTLGNINVNQFPTVGIINKSQLSK